MKTKILISIICVCSLFKVQAQVFPESDAIWNILIDGNEHYYGLSGDTIISDTIYNKLYLLNDTTLVIDSEDEYVGGFRQEGKRVWFRPNRPDDWWPGSPRETLLYDFSKNVGDTIWHNIILPSLHYWVMIENITASIIYGIVDSEYGKTYRISQYINDNGGLIGIGNRSFWIEGIGSLDGLFWFLYDPPMSGRYSFELACFKQGNEVKYIDNFCNRCFCRTTVGVSDKNNISLEIIQENNYIRIKGDSSVFPCLLKLFTPMGRLVLTKIVQSDKEEIPINPFKGIWLYQIQKENETIKTGKIVIK